MGKKKSDELSSKILAQQGANLTRKGRQGNNVANLLLRSLSLPRRKREVRSITKRRSSRSLSSSSTSLSSHSSSSENEEEDLETKNIDNVSNEDQFKWDLPSKPAFCANTHFKK